MDKKYWGDCPKEERELVNEIWRCHKMLNYLRKEGKVSETKYRRFVKQELKALEYVEWYWSDPVQDRIAFLNWKVGYQMYEQIRDVLK